MSHPEQTLIDRLGRDGLTRVLHDLLDRRRLVRLANTCGLRYPGMRTSSQKRERILADLVDRAGREETTRKAIYRALDKETRSAARSWKRLSPEQKLRRLDPAGEAVNGKLGLHLYLLAADGSEGGLEQQLVGLLGRPDLRPGDDPAVVNKELARLRREQSRLKKRVADHQKKTERLENQLDKAQETGKTLKRDLTTRQGELAEARALSERLRRQLKRATGAAKEASARAAGTPSDETLEKLTKGIARLSTEQRKLTHSLEKLLAAPAQRGVTADEITPLADGLKGLQKEIAAVRRERKKESQEYAELLAGLRTELRSYRSAVTKRVGGQLSPRRKGEPERVGVFVDVQNMYYGARQLKGKLDFDALLEAALRDRRMIQAKAYVVESKEIDQSGFIKMLEQRAIEVCRKTLKVRSDGSMKGDWDMEMALDILDLAPRLDVVVLVSGDGDFTSLVGRVKRMGPRVEVIGWPRITAKSLVEAADSFQPLDRKFMIRSENGPKKR